MEILRKKKGFTLVEVLISILVFTIFLGVLIGTYIQLIKGQREANQYRQIYVMAREVMEDFRVAVLDKGIDYPIDGVDPRYNGVMSCEDFGILDCEKYTQRCEVFNQENECVRGVEIKKMNFFVTPAANPYKPENLLIDSLQLQPKATLFLEIGYVGDDALVLPFQTTISSRNYN